MTNAEVLVGCAFLSAGIILVWNGWWALQRLYQEFSAYFPLKLSDNTAQILLHSFPLIFKTFVNTVGAICAVLMGTLWAVTGIGEALEGRRKWAQAPDLESPEVAAESLRSGQSLYWQTMGLPVRILARLVPRARYISPITYEMIHHVFVCVFRMAVLGAVIALILYVLGLVPVSAHKYLHREIRLAVPSGAPLYWILALLIIGNGLIALSLLPFRKPQYSRAGETVPVCGKGDPHLFFALLEEGCRLLSPQGQAPKSPNRLERSDNPVIKGTLIESRPKEMRPLARPAGYVCLPLIPVLLSSGFGRLTDFSPELSSIYFLDFLSLNLLSYTMDAGLGPALILAGVHCGEWARKLLGVRRFQSSVVFCNVAGGDSAGALAHSTGGETGSPRPPQWRPVEGIDEAFAEWAKNPSMERDFLVEIFWADAISESANEDGPRYMTDMRESEVLQDSMRRLTKLPFHVDLAPAVRETE
ncbi:MAG: hypothetical protein V1792_04340 [Pseudomonadota bacterium]